MIIYCPKCEHPMKEKRTLGKRCEIVEWRCPHCGVYIEVEVEKRKRRR